MNRFNIYSHNNNYSICTYEYLNIVALDRIHTFKTAHRVIKNCLTFHNQIIKNIYSDNILSVVKIVAYRIES